MKKLLLSIVFAVVALVNIEASYNKACTYERDNCWYVQANGSLGWHNNSKFSFNGDKINGIQNLNEKQKTGWGASLAIGYILEQWRLELEGSYRENSSKSKLYTSNTSLMANVYYDIPLGNDLTFYLGAGAGISSVNGKVHQVELEKQSYEFKKDKGHLDTVFAWQAMAGLSYALTEDVDLIAGYRLFCTTKPTLSKLNGEKLKMTNMPISNSVELGLRFKF